MTGGRLADDLRAPADEAPGAPGDDAGVVADEVTGTETGADGPGAPLADPHTLVDRALDAPGDVVAAARTALEAGAPSPQRALLLQALGIALRESGDATGALHALSRAARLATDTADEADVRATYAGTLVWAGRRRPGLAQFRRARAAARGAARARVDVRYGLVLGWVEAVDEATRVLRRAARELDRSGDTLWAARAWTNLGGALAHGGQLEAADVALAQAADRYAELGLTTEEAGLHHLRGYERWRVGALPEALSLLELAADRYAAAGAAPSSLAADRARVLLSAGLPTEAAAVVEAALARPGAEDEFALQNLLVVAARADLAAGSPDDARRHAERAARLHRRTGHDDGAREAALVALQARWQAGDRGRGLSRAARELAESMSAHRTADRSDAALLAGRVAVAQHEPESARRWFAAIAPPKRGLGPIERVQAALARGLLAQLDGDGAGVRRATRRGLTVLEEYRAALGSPELQARATAYGSELAALALRDAVRRGGAKDLLRCTEQWRATALHAPAAHQADDPDLAADVAALRAACRSLEELRAPAAPLRPTEPSPGAAAGAAAVDRLAGERGTADVPDVVGPAAAGPGWEPGARAEEIDRLRRTVSRLERRIHTRTLTRAADESRGAGGAALDALPEELRRAGARLVSLTRVDGRCHVVVAGGRRTRRVLAGSHEAMDRLAAQLQFLLRAAASGGPAAAEVLISTVDEVARALQQEAFGPALRLIGDGPVVLAPPARLHAAPWGALPAFAHRPVHVAASATTWLRARAVQPPADDQVTLVAGPDLPGGRDEVRQLAEGWPVSTVLQDGDATAAATLRALDGAGLVHLAAHGTFRGDNPLFSAFALADGPLWLHDLEGLARPPYRMVLSSCDSAAVAHAGTDELLGVTAALAREGTAGVVAGVVPVHDAATARLSVRLHAGLRAGLDLADALAQARRQAADPLDRLTAAAFLALGAA